MVWMSLWRENNMDYFNETEYSKAVESAVNFQNSSISREYVDFIKDEIQSLNKKINTTGEKYNIQKAKISGGFIAEEWHAGTFNVNAAIKDKKIRAEVPSSNSLGSEDVILNNGKGFSSKYYSNSVGSAKSQSTSHFEHFSRNTKEVSFDQWMELNKIDPDLINASIYEGQGRVIPSNQLDGAKAYLEKKIQKEATNRPELVEKYKETLKHLTDRIESDGVESRTLSKRESTRIAAESREGNYSVEKDGITEKQLLMDNQSALIKKSLKTGLTAASITIAIEMTPELIKILKLTVEDSGYEFSDFVGKLGDSGKKGADSFLLGTLSSYIVISNEAGLLGEALQNASSETIAATVLILYNTIKISVDYAKGNISKSEMAYQISSQTIGVIGAAIGSAAFQFIPVIGTMVGSMVGSIIANTVFNHVNNMMLGIAIENGCAFFGIVDHSYELPDEVLEELGYDILNYFECEQKNIDYHLFNYHNFNYHEIEYHEMDLVFVKRGVIGVNKIGYI